MLFDLTDLRRLASGTTDEAGWFSLSPESRTAGASLPERLSLGQNYPNPFNPSTIIPYQLPAAAHVRLEVFNLLGQRIATLVNGHQPAGFHAPVGTAPMPQGGPWGPGSISTGCRAGRWWPPSAWCWSTDRPAWRPRRWLSNDPALPVA